MALQHPTLLLTQIKLAAAGLSLYDFGPKNPPNSQLCFFLYCSPHFKNSESGLLQFYSTAQRNNTLVLCELGIFCNIVHDRGEEEIYPDYVHCTEKTFMYVMDEGKQKKSINGLSSKSIRKKIGNKFRIGGKI